MSRRRQLAAALCVLTTACDCVEEERYAIVIDAYGESLDALLEGTVIEVTSRGLDEDWTIRSPSWRLDRDLGANEPVAVRVDLDGPGQALVHVVARGIGGVYLATRCYVVTGVIRSEVLLTGPGDSGDADLDSWPQAEGCRERGAEQIGCNDQCPEPWAVDCEPVEPDVNPGAVERCENGIDEDCDGKDVPCDP